MHATSWTGSETQRREQGGCKPPTAPPNTTPRYTIQAKTPCQIRRVTETKWQSYVTRGTTHYDRCEGKPRSFLIFRLEGYQIRVLARRVQVCQ